MTRYTVIWDPVAEEELAEIWLKASDRAEVTATALAIDQELVNDPAAKGDDLAEGLRGLSAPPLRVLFYINDDDRIACGVRVTRSTIEGD